MIRKATEADLNSLASIAGASFENAPWGASLFETEFGKVFSNIYVYEDDGVLAGYLVFWVISDEGEILSLAVLPEYRRQGIADKLLSHIFKKYSFVAKWYLEVSTANQGAVNLYKKYHFEKSRTIKNYYGVGRDALFMISKFNYFSDCLISQGNNALF